jgi:hypothetical protein
MDIDSRSCLAGALPFVTECVANLDSHPIFRSLFFPFFLLCGGLLQLPHSHRRANKIAIIASRIPAVQRILVHNHREDCGVEHHDLLVVNFNMTDVKKEKKKTKKSSRKDVDDSKDEPKQALETGNDALPVETESSKAVKSTESPSKKEKKKEKKLEKRTRESEDSKAKDLEPVEDTTSSSSSPAKKKRKKEKKKKKDKKPANNSEKPVSDNESPTDEDPPVLEGSMVEDQMVLIDRTKGIVYSGLERLRNGDLKPIGKLENGKAVLDKSDEAVSGKLPFCFRWEMMNDLHVSKPARISFP